MLAWGATTGIDSSGGEAFAVEGHFRKGRMAEIVILHLRERGRYGKGTHGYL
jgi:hypothetical protein